MDFVNQVMQHPLLLYEASVCPIVIEGDFEGPKTVLKRTSEMDPSFDLVQEKGDISIVWA